MIFKYEGKILLKKISLWILILLSFIYSLIFNIYSQIVVFHYSLIYIFWYPFIVFFFPTIILAWFLYFNSNFIKNESYITFFKQTSLKPLKIFYQKFTIFLLILLLYLLIILFSVGVFFINPERAVINLKVYGVALISLIIFIIPMFFVLLILHQKFKNIGCFFISIIVGIYSFLGLYGLLLIGHGQNPNFTSLRNNYVLTKKIQENQDYQDLYQIFTNNDRQQLNQKVTDILKVKNQLTEAIINEFKNNKLYAPQQIFSVDDVFMETNSNDNRVKLNDNFYLYLYNLQLMLNPLWNEKDANNNIISLEYLIFSVTRTNNHFKQIIFETSHNIYSEYLLSHLYQDLFETVPKIHILPLNLIFNIKLFDDYNYNFLANQVNKQTQKKNIFFGLHFALQNMSLLPVIIEDHALEFVGFTPFLTNNLKFLTAKDFQIGLNNDSFINLKPIWLAPLLHSVLGIGLSGALIFFIQKYYGNSIISFI